MQLDDLDDLLPDVFQDEACEQTGQCLSIRTLYELSERPGAVSEGERTHFRRCGYCKRQVARLRKNRHIIASPAAAATATAFAIDAGLFEYKRAAHKGKFRI